MNLKQPTPPSGSILSSWCAGLNERLKNAFLSIEDENILSLSASKLIGSVDPNAVPISGVNVTIDANGITVMQDGATLFHAGPEGEIYIGNANGTEYVKLSGGHINIRAASIVCDTLDAGTINGEAVSL